MALHTTWCCVTVPTVSTVWLLVTHVHTMSHKRRYLTGADTCAHEVGPFGEDGVHDLEQRMLPAKTTHAGPWIPAPPSARSSEQAPTCAEWGSLTPIPSPKRTPLPTCPHASVTQQTLGTHAKPKGGHAPGTLSKPALCPHSCGRGRPRAHLQTGGGRGQASLSQHLGGSRKSDVGLARWLALTGPQPCTPRPTPVFHSLESSSHLPHLRRFLSPNFSGRHRDHAHRSPKHGLRAPGPPPCGLQLQ